jgi:transmembrane sensor
MAPETPRTEQPDPPMDWDAVARYLAGESPAEEADAVRKWLAEHPGDAELVRALDGTLDRLAIAPSGEIDVEGALQKVAARRDAADTRSIIRPITRPGKPDLRIARPAPRWGSPALRTAAAIAVAAAGLAIWQATRKAGETTGAGHTYVTGVGQRDSVRLPDGSRVILGPESKLTVAAGYGTPGRDVALEGEAYFDVLHDDAHAFAVRAGGASVRDIGTTFTVRTAASREVRVAVTSGVVLLTDTAGTADRGVVLHQGDVGVLRAGGLTEAQRGRASEDDVAWTSGRLVFRDAPLAEVQAELRRWYGIELRVADPALADRHLTITLAGDPPDQVLRVIELALGASIERRGDTAVVHAAGAGPRR